MAEQIVVDIPLKGISTGKTKLTFKTSGFVGTTCVDASKFLQESFGKVVLDEPTNEMYEDAEQQKQRLGRDE